MAVFPFILKCEKKVKTLKTSKSEIQVWNFTSYSDIFDVKKKFRLKMIYKKLNFTSINNIAHSGLEPITKDCLSQLY